MTVFPTNPEPLLVHEHHDIPFPRERTSKLLNEHQAAALLNVAVKTLRNWRCRGDGPVFVKLGAKSIRYRDHDLADFIDRDVRTSTSNRGL
ncbi:helix-turn-helix transcriptional regulator [Methylobacterium sp. CM6244]